MRSDFLKATTKYNDLLGSSAADASDSTVADATSIFEDVFVDAGLDLNEYYPVAYGFEMPEENWQPDPESVDPDVYLIAHCVRRNKVGSSDQDVIDYANQNNGQLPVERFSYKTSPKEFLSLFKRLQIMFPRGGGDFQRYRQGGVTPMIEDEHHLN